MYQMSKTHYSEVELLLQRVYDHRLRALVQNTGDAHLAIRKGVPPSTARGWLRQGPCTVMSIDVAEMAPFPKALNIVLSSSRQLELVRHWKSFAAGYLAANLKLGN